MIKKNIIRVVNIFLLNRQGQVFLPKRTKLMKRWPDCYDFACGKHVLSKETYKEAALRGLKEELNLDLPEKKLISLGKLTPKNGVSSLMKIYKLVVNKMPKYSKKEFSSASFISLEKLESLINKRPKEFKDDFPKVYRLLKHKIKEAHKGTLWLFAIVFQIWPVSLFF